ncbi:hypothetical protein LCGC14_2770180 [marine sediment metagenome]|uniref:Phage-like element PBSX protein XkdF domain-containing protein n=1 Tax=marine sediment metagenome TaxID=412755 RepID=A0A0F8ZI71_9ZZZZ
MEKFNRSVKIVKIDEEQHNVWGIFSVSKVGNKLIIDSQNDIIQPEELEKAAHNFSLSANRQMGNKHEQMQVGQLIESFVLTPEKGEFLEKALKNIGAEATIKPDSTVWFGGFHVEDSETWDLIKSGEFKSFSIGGMAEKIEVS